MKLTLTILLISIGLKQTTPNVWGDFPIYYYNI